MSCWHVLLAAEATGFIYYTQTAVNGFKEYVVPALHGVS